MPKKKLKLDDKPLDDEIKQKIVAQCIKQMDAGLKFKQPRMDQWQLNEDLYLNRAKPALKGRFNTPIPVMGGFIDQLLSLLDEKPRLQRKHTTEGGMLKAKKVDAQWEIDSSSMKANWPRKDRNAKKLAALTGLGIFEIYSESDPKYKHYLNVIDPYDFVGEPLGGSNLEDHRFWFVDNVFKSKEDLRDEGYDKSQIAKLVAVRSKGDKKTDNVGLYRSKISRYNSLNLDGYFNDYTGDTLYRLTKGGTTYKGERYYVLFDYQSGVWVEVEKLKDKFESELWPVVIWQTHEDPFNYLSKAPADDIRPVAEAIHVLFNQALENRQKRNWGQRAFDASIFPDPSKLEYRPDGLVLAKVPANKNINQGIYSFETPEVTGTIDMITFMDNFLGAKTGINPQAAGATDKDPKVGIYFGNLNQMAGRMGLYNKSYSEAWEQLGLRYDWGLYEHMTEGMMIHTIGKEGVEWQELEKSDVEPDFNIIVIGSTAEQEVNEIKKKEKSNAILAIQKDQSLIGLVSPKWRLATILRSAGYEEDEIHEAMDFNNEGNAELMAEAADRIEQILKGKDPKPFRGATPAFVQKIIDFAYDHDMAIEMFLRLNAYVQLCMPFVIQNNVRKARTKALWDTIAKTEALPNAPKAPTTGLEGLNVGPGTNQPIQASPGGTQARVQDETNQVAPMIGQ